MLTNFACEVFKQGLTFSTPLMHFSYAHQQHQPQKEHQTPTNS